MGWKSTVDLTREQALARILTLIHAAEDRDLAFAVEVLQGDDVGYNYRIVTPDRLQEWDRKGGE